MREKKKQQLAADRDQTYNLCITPSLYVVAKVVAQATSFILGGVCRTQNAKFSGTVCVF